MKRLTLESSLYKSRYDKVIPTWYGYSYNIGSLASRYVIDNTLIIMDDEEPYLGIIMDDEEPYLGKYHYHPCNNYLRYVTPFIFNNGVFVGAICFGAEIIEIKCTVSNFMKIKFNIS